MFPTVFQKIAKLLPDPADNKGEVIKMSEIYCVPNCSGAKGAFQANAAKDEPRIGIKGELEIKKGKSEKYQAVTDAVNSAKWEITDPDGNVKIEMTKTVILKPNMTGSYNLRLFVTDPKGNTNEMLLTVNVKAK